MGSRSTNRSQPTTLKPSARQRSAVHLRRLRHVCFEPLEHRLGATLELEVAVPACGRPVDPLELLVGDRNVVEHCLDIARLGEYVVTDLVQEGRDRDAL